MTARTAIIDEQLLAQTIACAPRGDLYVFGYGSLMWRPGFSHKQKNCGYIYGYSRRCAVISTHYRGTPACPGLVLGLDAGGSCGGMLYRVAAAHKARVIRYLFKREMFADAYHPRYVSVFCNRQPPRCALTFVVRRDRSHYAAPMPIAQTAAIIRRARGIGGANSDYFYNTRHHLQQIGIRAPMIDALCRLLD